MPKGQCFILWSQDIKAPSPVLISAACHDQDTSELRQRQLLPFNHLPYPKLERTTHTCTVADATYEGCACLDFASDNMCAYVNVHANVDACHCMPVLVWICKHIWMCVCLWIHAHVWTFAYVWIYVHAHVFSCWICTQTCMGVCMLVHAYLCVKVCLYMDVLVCMYLFKCAQITFTCAEWQQPIWTFYFWPVEATLLGLPADPGSGFPVKHT